MNSNNGHSHQSSSDVVLITGAGGSIGSALAKETCAQAQQRCATARQVASPTVVLLDNSEQNLYEIDSELSSTSAKPPRHVSILGDTNDASLLADLFEKYRPTTVFHAAAFKHVPLMEENPIAVIRNNVLGTSTLTAAAIKHKARKLVMVSTDKAADPASIMGATKRVAELLLSSLDSPETRFRSVRLCNVLRSTGSVVPRFERQIRTGGPVTITDPDASRYFISLEDASHLIFLTDILDDPGTLFIPQLDSPIKIADLARKMIAEASDSSTNQIKIALTGLRPGEKLEERLISSSEALAPTADPKLRRVTGPIPTVETLRSTISLISDKLHSRDLPALIDAIRSLVPEYHPSALISAQISTQLSATAKA